MDGTDNERDILRGPEFGVKGVGVPLALAVGVHRRDERLKLM